MISINKLTLENIHQMDNNDADNVQHCGEICLDGKSIGTFSENIFDEPIKIVFNTESSRKKVQIICNRYFRKYPPIVDGLKNSIEAMMIELLNLNLAQAICITKIAVVFMLESTCIYEVDGNATIDDVMRNIAIEYPDMSTRVKIFVIENGEDLALTV